MAVGHLTIRRYKINIRPENFRPMIFQWFGEAADLIVGQMLCPRPYSPLLPYENPTKIRFLPLQQFQRSYKILQNSKKITVHFYISFNDPAFIKKFWTHATRVSFRTAENLLGKIVQPLQYESSASVKLIF